MGQVCRWRQLSSSPVRVLAFKKKNDEEGHTLLLHWYICPCFLLSWNNSTETNSLFQAWAELLNHPGTPNWRAGWSQVLQVYEEKILSSTVNWYINIQTSLLMGHRIQSHSLKLLSYGWNFDGKRHNLITRTKLRWYDHMKQCKNQMDTD